MKKSLLSFSMLILGIGLFSTKTLAQIDAGGASFQGITTDGGIAGAVYSSPPSSIKHVKRNNGNGTTQTGTGEARLSFKGAISDIELLNVTYLSDNSCVTGAVTEATRYGATINSAKGYISYPLGKNINPAKKLLFHFKSCDTGKVFCIPESN